MDIYVKNPRDSSETIRVSPVKISIVNWTSDHLLSEFTGEEQLEIFSEASSRLMEEVGLMERDLKEILSIADIYGEDHD